MSEELRDEIAETLANAGHHWPWAVADKLLSGPLAPLLAAQAAVERVEVLLAAWKRGEPAGGYLPTLLRRALDGPGS